MNWARPYAIPDTCRFHSITVVQKLQGILSATNRACAKDTASRAEGTADNNPFSTVLANRIAEVPKPDNYIDGLDELIEEQKLNGEIAWKAEDFQLKPDSIAIADPEKHEGLEFPGDCALYGRLASIAKGHERLQLGWLYPSLLIVASCLDIEDADHHVRANEYGALIGGVHTGKNAHMDVALASICIPDRESVVMEDAPGSHSGLMNQLSEEEGPPVSSWPPRLPPGPLRSLQPAL